MTKELQKKSVSDLIKTWINLMRANTQRMIDKNATQWHTSIGYNKAIENIEITIADKLQITVLEVKVMLNYKKKAKDVKDKKLVKTKRKRLMDKKRRKYLNKLTKGMEDIQGTLFNVHHAVAKLSPIIVSDNEEANDEAAH